LAGKKDCRCRDGCRGRNGPLGARSLVVSGPLSIGTGACRSWGDSGKWWKEGGGFSCAAGSGTYTVHMYIVNSAGRGAEGPLVGRDGLFGGRRGKKSQQKGMLLDGRRRRCLQSRSVYYASRLFILLVGKHDCATWLIALATRLFQSRLIRCSGTEEQQMIDDLVQKGSGEKVRDALPTEWGVDYCIGSPRRQVAFNRT